MATATKEMNLGNATTIVNVNATGDISSAQDINGQTLNITDGTDNVYASFIYDSAIQAVKLNFSN